MAIAMGVGWRASDMGGSVMSKKRSWGDDQQKLFDLMIGAQNTDNARRTLDLLGGNSTSQRSEFVELDTEMPLPSGWEKRLDLKSGAVYFVNWSSGSSTPFDPRNPPLQAAASSTSHEFLSSKQSELQNQELFSSSDDHVSSKPCESRDNATPKLQAASLELNLKLCISEQQLDSTGASTMEKLQQAIARSPKPTSYHFLDTTAASVGAAFSTPSPATTSSSSSSTFSSKRARIRATKDHRKTKKSETVEHVDRARNVKLTVCKNCFMYVMLSASDPRCPRCSSTVMLDFSLSVENSITQLNL